MALPHPPRAPLFLIGGGSGNGSWELLEEFARRAGGSSARIAVITSGSREPQRTGDRYERFFTEFGLAVSIYHLLSRAAANDPARFAGLADADAIFFSGGEQLCITARLGGSAALAVIRARHAAGVLLGGTSAGTSVMSRTMIAFGLAGEMPRHNLVNLAPGLGFLPGVVLDQHFHQRGRLGRLITAVSYNPEELGVGIDEDTAAVFHPDGQVEVLGRAAVTLVDGLPLHTNDSPDVDDLAAPLQIEGMEVYRLHAGARFDLHTRRPTILSPPAP